MGDGDEYGENGCAVLFDCLPEEAGHYVMCYYSYKLDCVISVSDPFEVRYDTCAISQVFLSCRVQGRKILETFTVPFSVLKSSSWLVKMISF